MLGLPEILEGRAHQNVFLQSSQSFRKPRMQVCQQTVRRVKFDITRKMELNQSPSFSLVWLDKTSRANSSIQNPLNTGINKNIHMTQLFAKCPKCGTETKAKRSTRWRMCAEGDCDSCGVHFTTAAFWQSK